jgi:hypothetical protein
MLADMEIWMLNVDAGDDDCNFAVDWKALVLI